MRDDEVPTPAAVLDRVRRVIGEVTHGEWIETTRQRYATLDPRIGPGAGDDPIYVVQLQGTFTSAGFPKPRGATPGGEITAHALVLIMPVAPGVHGRGGFRLGGRPRDLAALAQVHLLRLH